MSKWIILFLESRWIDEYQLKINCDQLFRRNLPQLYTAFVQGKLPKFPPKTSWGARPQAFPVPTLADLLRIKPNGRSDEVWAQVVALGGRGKPNTQPRRRGQGRTRGKGAVASRGPVVPLGNELQLSAEAHVRRVLNRAIGEEP